MSLTLPTLSGCARFLALPKHSLVFFILFLNTTVQLYSQSVDTDNDGVIDSIDIDDDNDGILDIDEGMAGGFKEDFGKGGRVPSPYSTYTYENGKAGPGKNKDLNDGEYAVFSNPEYTATWAPTVWMSIGDFSSATSIGIVNNPANSQNGKESFTAGPGVAATDTNNAERMLIVNAVNTSGLEFYRRPFGQLIGGAPVNIAYHIINIDTSNASGIASRRRPNITLNIENSSGTVIATYNSGDIPADDKWYKQAFTFTASVTDNYTMVMINNAPGGLGNDLAIDNITAESFNLDEDNDGLSNGLDLDSDNDGIPDIIEAGGIDINGDGIVDNDTDTDGDGWADVFDPDNGGTPLANKDSDNDGKNDYLDLDSDNDGLPDIIEAGETDSNNDGLVDNSTDTDQDGWANTFDKDNGGSTPNLIDTDGDGVHNHLDVDSDHDGIPDIIEAGGSDANGDGRADNTSDTDGDGWVNLYDADDSGNVHNPDDKDGDGLLDYLDLDADGDGIADVIEAGGTDANNDGKHDGLDADSDGLSDVVDTDNGGTKLAMPDTDSDGLNNYLDIDADNDGLIDNVEAQSTSNFQSPIGSDSDNDGWDNRYDSDNEGTAISLNNNDSSGGPDYIDLDTDGDNRFDWIEGFDDDMSGMSNNGDALNDLLARSLDFSTNGGNSSYYNNTIDTDNDGIPNWLEDNNANGVPNFLDPSSSLYRDTDNDGLVDLFDTDNFGASSIYPNRDNDAEPDWRDDDNSTTLPVTLLSFEVEKKPNSALLRWTTLSEINNDFFTIERSTDAVNFYPIGKVNGSGNSNQLIDYNYLDQKPYEGVSYYRLSQTDFDGVTRFSDVKAISINRDKSLPKIYPNPAESKQELNIPIPSIKDREFLLNIRSTTGKILKSVPTTEISSQYNNNTLRIKLPELSKGLYLIEIVNNQKVLRSEKLIIK